MKEPNAEKKVKAPVQVLTGSFNEKTNKYRQFIPVKISVKGAELHSLIEGASWAACDMHGCGISLPSLGGDEAYAILVEERSHDGKYLPFGNWIVTYLYNDQEGTHSHELFLAAEIY